jgi:hypothetical protein
MASLGRFTLTLDRHRIVLDFCRALDTADRRRFCGQVVVAFANEGATDSGGPSREFVQLVSAELFSDASLFELVNLGQFYWFRAHVRPDARQRRALRAAGVLVRLALSNGLTVSIPLPPALFKALKGEPLTLQDLADVDPDLAESLAAWRRAYRIDGEDYGLTFTVPDCVDGVAVEQDLCNDGHLKAVTADNFDEYVQAVIHYKLGHSVDQSLSAFVAGFHWVEETTVIKRLNARDLELLLSGTEVTDWSELKQAADYNGYEPLSPTVQMFWRIFDAWEHAEKSRFLQFATGSARAPVGGLKTMRFTIERTDDVGQIPTARTCTGQFILPDASDEVDLKRRLEICLSNCTGFGFS